MTPINNRHDTIITYGIDNLSSEGAETHVLYKGGQIKESTVYVYGAGGKMEIKYIFNRNFIDVREQTYLYQDTSLNKVDTLNVIRYKIDYRGRVVGKKLSQYADIFEEFKKSCPFYFEIKGREVSYLRLRTAKRGCISTKLSNRTSKA